MLLRLKYGQLPPPTIITVLNTIRLHLVELAGGGYIAVNGAQEQEEAGRGVQIILLKIVT
jgi:hypothetical protein